MKRLIQLLGICLWLGMTGCSGESSAIGDDDNKTGNNQDPTEEPVIPVEQCKLADTDGDTIADENEGDDEVDTDGDTIPDYKSEDSDGDTIPDAVEALNDGNPCKKPQLDALLESYAFQSLDADYNGIPDAEEACPKNLDKTRDCGFDSTTQFYMKPNDLDKDGVPDFIDSDNDGDKLTDDNEIKGIMIEGHVGRHCDEHCTCGEDDWCQPGTTENPLDSDGDTLPDYMDNDSNGDGVPDIYKGFRDTDGDGVADIYSLDSDGDTIPDKDEFGTGDTPLDTDSDNIYDFQDLDSDNDGLPDADEIRCENISKDSWIWVDTDGDGQSDLAEYVLAQEYNADPAEYICNSDKTVLDFVEFFFDLPSKSDEEKSMTLFFEPQITKADVLLNIDNTGSMGSAISNMQENFTPIIATVVKQNVPDSWFGASIFRDMDAMPVWQLYSAMNSDLNAFSNVLRTISVSSANTDDPEGGYEALYEIATGDNSGNPKAYEKVSKPTGENLVGGAGFRKGSMPIILHVSNASSHDEGDSGYKGHSSTQAFKALNAIGARVIPVGITITSEREKVLATGKKMATNTNAIVPVCAYQDDNGAWACGQQKCCTNKNDDASYTTIGDSPDENGNCILSLDAGTDANALFTDNRTHTTHNMMAYKTMLAVEALVKYGSYNVSTRVIGTKFQDSEIIDPQKADSSCFINRIEAISYTPPSNPTVRACLETLNTQPKDFAGKGFNDGFENFAVGAASEEQGKSKLEFKVYAKNDNCVKPYEHPRSYRATIQVYDPTTELVFDEQDVVIIVPGFWEADN